MRDSVSRSSYLASDSGLIPFLFGVKLARIHLFPLRCLVFVFSSCAPTDTYRLKGGNCHPIMYLYHCSSIFVFELAALSGFYWPPITACVGRVAVYYIIMEHTS